MVGTQRLYLPLSFGDFLLSSASICTRTYGLRLVLSNDHFRTNPYIRFDVDSVSMASGSATGQACTW